MSLYKSMQKGGHSYGVVPGNGHPKADDKLMKAAEGHVVPAENAHIAKKIVADMGYDPNVKVDMNNGGSDGVPVKISSKEYFLNQEQVDEMKRRGMNPEALSPNSPYNKTDAMQNGGSLYGLMNKSKLMSNNNNQYPSAQPYQDGGGVHLPIRFGGETYKWDPELQSWNLPGAVGEQGPRWLQKSIAESYGPGGVYEDLAGTRPTYEQFMQQRKESQTPDPVNQGAGEDFVVDYTSTEVDQFGSKTYGPDGKLIRATDPQGNEIPMDAFDPNNMPTTEALSEERMNELGVDPTQLVVPGTNDMMYPTEQPTEETAPVTEDPLASAENPESTTPGEEGPAGKSPEQEHLEYLQNELKKNSNQEIAANLAMMGWNVSRERQPAPKPIYNAPRELVRDYQGMKGQAEKDLERQARSSAYQMKQLGMPDKLVALDANTKENQMKIDQSIWDLQQQDSMRNIAASNQAKQAYYDKLWRHGMAESQAANQFAQEKGRNIAENTAQIFDVKDNRFNNEAVLKGYEMNQKMNELDDQYNKLDKKKMLEGGKGYVSRDDWYKMSDEQRNQYMNLE